MLRRNIFAGFIFALFLILPGRQVHAAGEFITTWQTDNPGVSNDDQITIPTSDGFDYDYDVDWGDGSSDENVTDSITHTYDEPGTYQVSITGQFPGMFFVLDGDRQKLLSIDQWGDSEWATMSGAFFGCTNLTIEATDAPDLSGVADMTYAFRSSGLTTEDLSDWDMSSVTTAIGMFQDTLFNGDVTTWDVSHMTNPGAMFFNNSAFNQDIGDWDLSSATTLNGMFYGNTVFNQDIGSWDTSNVTNMAELFYNADAFDQDLSGWNVEGVTAMDDMFEGAGLSNANYDALLAGWSTQTLQANVELGVGNSSYCDTDSHDLLTSAPNNWNISDGGNLCLITIEAIPSRVTIADAVYYFSVTEAVQEALDNETGSFLSEAPTCADCEVRVSYEPYALLFSGLQVGDQVHFNIIFLDGATDVGTNGLEIGPFTVIEPDRGGSRRSKTGFHPSTTEENINKAERPTTGISPFDGSVEDITPVAAGMFIRAEHYDTVYYIDQDLTRRPFYDSQTYFTWEDSFDSIVWVTDATLATLPLGKPMLPKPGVVLVKIQSDANVYAIEEGHPTPILRLIANEQTAIDVYGLDWAKMVMDLPPTLFSYFMKP